MRWFSARRPACVPAVRIAARLFPKPLRAAVFALACLAGAGFSAGERSAARADDGGMMSFLLSGNGGRVRVAAPAARAVAPVVRQSATASRKIAAARSKARAHRLAWSHKHSAKHQLAVGSASALIQKASFEIAPQPEPRPIAQALALKAAAAASRPDDTHLHDRTLRRGDIVATTAGLRVFLGSEQFPYKPRDFASVTTARHIAQRTDLEALDRAMRGVRVLAPPARKRLVKAPVRMVPKAETIRIAQPRSGPAVQTVALAYAPKSDFGSVAPQQAPAVQAIERVVRHIQIAPTQRTGGASLPVMGTAGHPSSRNTE